MTLIILIFLSMTEPILLNVL